MTCPRCHQWELATGDLACAWCGASHLHFTAQLTPPTVTTTDYPPPLQLQIHNHSPLGTITIDRITSSQPWLTLLPNQTLPKSIPPNLQHTFLLDADTFTPNPTPEATLTITALYAPSPQTATLHLQSDPNTP